MNVGVARRRAAALAALAVVLVPACEGTGTERQNLTVFAASSLTEAFGQIGRDFEAANPGTRVRFSFGASASQVQQVGAGAPADVLATADAATMQRAVAGGEVGGPVVFARNRLAILVARGNPKSVHTLADLARPGLVVVLCAPDVPCGRLGTRSLAAAGVVVVPRSFEPSVKGVQSKVVLGEADAGIVYVTDVRAAGDRAEGVPLPEAHGVVTSYPIAVATASGRKALAAAFVDHVLSEAGWRVLAAAGFER